MRRNIEEREATKKSENVSARLDKLEQMIIESAKLSQNAIITYSVVIVLALGMILFAVLLFVSYFAAHATPETPFIQRVAQSVWRLLPLEIQSNPELSVAPTDTNHWPTQ